MAKSGQIAEVAEANRLSGDGIHEMVGEIGMAAGVPGEVRPHGIRHTSITKAARLMKAANLGLPALQAFSDHRSLATLGRYIDSDNGGAAALAELVGRW